VRRLDETRTTGFVAGLALPLPLWNPQGGAVAAAQAEIVAARAREHAARLQLRNEVEGALGRIVIARATHDAVRTRIQPAAIEALAQVRSGYRAGRLSYTDLLDAQRAVRESDLALIEANVDLWRARIALDRLIGERAVVPSTEEESR
jgi:cobalt-zinc-cadmium efflux system outer membrane protein